MSNGPRSERRSVPVPRPRPPRPLEPREIATAVTLADALCWSRKSPVRPPSGCAEFDAALHLALAARQDAFGHVTAALAEAADVSDPAGWLRSLARSRPGLFASLSTILAGAYLMVPEVRAAVGYPGQGHHPAAPTQIGDELSGGILDRVIDRGPIYRTL